MVTDKSVRSLRSQLGWVRRELHEYDVGHSRVLLVSREWVKDTLGTRMCELENQIVIRLGVGEEKE